MHATTIASITTLVASAVLAAPATESFSLETRQSTSAVFLCTDAGFTGRCVNIVQPIGECVDLSSDLDDLVSSVGPDQNSGDCRFFFDHGCIDNNGFRHFDTRFPGINNLGASNPGANDQISSYQCFGPGS